MCVVIPDLSALVLALHKRRLPTYYLKNKIKKKARFQTKTSAASAARAKGTSARVKVVGCHLQFALSPLLLSVDRKIAFWYFLFYFFLNDRKQREDYFGISVILSHIILYKSLWFFFLDLHFVKTINSIINIQLKPKEKHL